VAERSCSVKNTEDMYLHKVRTESRNPERDGAEGDMGWIWVLNDKRITYGMGKVWIWEVGAGWEEACMV
jgi:hypothetical protein